METPAPQLFNSPQSKAPHGPYHKNRRTNTTIPDRSYPAPLDRSKSQPLGSLSAFQLEEHVIHPHPQFNLYSAPPKVDRSAQRATETPRAPPSQSLSASQSVDSATEKGANAKLPHGLTVHELKEMTKARLVAEAIQRGDVAPALEFHCTVPSTVRVSSEYRDAMGVRSALSPVPPHSYGRLATRNQYPADSATEAWESASVSTSASDYPGSESVYSSGLNGNASFNGDEAIPFSRSASYPSNHLLHDWSHENRPPSYIAAPSTYYDGYAPNRRRAATLSPRPGLSFVHENRPVLTGQMPSIPADFAAPSLQRQIATRSRSAFAPDSLNYGLVAPPPAAGYQPAGVIGDSTNGEVNRPRTLSAATLSGISHISEEFTSDNRGSSGHFSGQFGFVREDVVDSVAGLSDVFRGASPSCFGDSARIGFGSNNSSIGLGSSMNSFSGDAIRMRAATSSDFDNCLSDSLGLSTMDDHRHRAATWGEPSLDIFCGHDLSDDLASILKLSGAEQRDEST